MSIRKFSTITPNILDKEFSFFTLIVGSKSSDMFDYFRVGELHGLKRGDCYDRPGDSYVAGFCNVYPDGSGRHFLFLNSSRFTGTYLDYLLVMHEAFHLSLEKWGHNLESGDLEEQVITWSEEVSIEIIEFLKSSGFLKII